MTESSLIVSNNIMLMLKTVKEHSKSEQEETKAIEAELLECEKHRQWH